MNCILFINKTITVTTTPGQSRPGSNDNAEVLHSTQIYRTRASLFDTVSCHFMKRQIVLIVPHSSEGLDWDYNCSVEQSCLIEGIYLSIYLSIYSGH